MIKNTLIPLLILGASASIFADPIEYLGGENFRDTTTGNTIQYLCSHGGQPIAVWYYPKQVDSTKPLNASWKADYVKTAKIELLANGMSGLRGGVARGAYTLNHLPPNEELSDNTVEMTLEPYPDDSFFINYVLLSRPTGITQDTTLNVLTADSNNNFKKTIEMPIPKPYAFHSFDFDQSHIIDRTTNKPTYVRFYFFGYQGTPDNKNVFNTSIPMTYDKKMKSGQGFWVCGSKEQENNGNQ